jgi:MazG family protein
MREMATFETLVWIMDRLRDPDHGCPWDREQDYSTLRGFLLEECYEVAHAIDRADPEQLREELGDLLFQIVFLSRLGKEQGAFTAADVVQGIADKMTRRHPHVFGSARADTSDEVLRSWEAIKRHERGQADREREDTSLLAGLPAALPAVLRAQRLGARAARVGFDWPHAEGVMDKVREELAELWDAVSSADTPRVREELGDVLFSLVMLARRLEVDAEQALERANSKFVARFERVEREARRRGIRLEEADAALLDRLWNDAKAPE